MKITAHLDYQTILANQAVPIYFALQLQAPEITAARPHPAAFCVVLDRSGSMDGVPLERAKDAAQVAIKNLRPDDLFSLVTFDDEARTVIPLQPAKDKQQLHQAVAAICSGGSTNLTGGWMLGRDQLTGAPAGTSRRALLLSDGHLNAGIIEPAQVRGIVASGLEQAAIRTSCLGFGDGYNEDLMTGLAAATGGVFYDAVSPEKFPAIFDSELQGLQKLAAQNVRLRLKPLDFCDGCVPLGDYPSVQLPDGRPEFALGDLVSGEERVVVFALSVLPLPAVDGRPVTSLEGEQLIEIELAYDEFTAEGVASKTFTQVMRIQSTQDPAQVVVNAQVIPWVALQRAAQAIKESIQRLDAGDARGAHRMVAACQVSLNEYGPVAAEAVQDLNELREKIEQQTFDARARKSASYRAASHRRMSSRDHWTGPGPAPSYKTPEPPAQTPESHDLT